MATERLFTVCPRLNLCLRVCTCVSMYNQISQWGVISSQQGLSHHPDSRLVEVQVSRLSRVQYRWTAGGGNQMYQNEDKKPWTMETVSRDGRMQQNKKNGGTTEVNQRDKSQFMSTNHRDLCEALIAFYQTLVQIWVQSGLIVPTSEVYSIVLIVIVSVDFST